jgi:hypothetical protein
LVQSSGVVNLATVNCFLVLSFHLSLFVLFQFFLLPSWVVLAFQRSFFFACNSLANFFFSFCSCCIFCWTLSSSLSMVSSSSSSFSCVCCSVGCSWMCAVF